MCIETKTREEKETRKMTRKTVMVLEFKDRP
jgi:hypothetical protein